MSTGTYRRRACAGCGVLSPDLPASAIDFSCSSCSPDGVASCRQDLGRRAPRPDPLLEQASEQHERARTGFLSRPLRHDFFVRLCVLVVLGTALVSASDRVTIGAPFHAGRAAEVARDLLLSATLCGAALCLLALLDWAGSRRAPASRPGGTGLGPRSPAGPRGGPSRQRAPWWRELLRWRRGVPWWRQPLWRRQRLLRWRSLRSVRLAAASAARRGRRVTSRHGGAGRPCDDSATSASRTWAPAVRPGPAPVVAGSRTAPRATPPSSWPVLTEPRSGSLPSEGHSPAREPEAPHLQAPAERPPGALPPQIAAQAWPLVVAPGLGVTVFWQASGADHVEITGRPGRLPATGQCLFEVVTDGPVEVVAVNAAGRTAVRTAPVEVIDLPAASPVTAGPPTTLPADGSAALHDDVLDRLAAPFLALSGPWSSLDGPDVVDLPGGLGPDDLRATPTDDHEAGLPPAARGPASSPGLDGLPAPGALPRPVAPQLPALDQPLLAPAGPVRQHPFRTATPTGPWPAMQEDPS